MGFPSFRDMIEPLLRILAEASEGLPARRAQDLVADHMQLPADDRARRVPSGTQVLFRHRTNWAHDRLKRAQLSSTPRRGVWHLTPKGFELVRARTQSLSKEEVRELAKAGRDAPRARAATEQLCQVHGAAQVATPTPAIRDGKHELSA